VNELRQKKLRGYVLPTLYVIILMLVFGAVSLVSSMLKSNPDYLYSIGIINTDTRTVVETNDVPIISRPYTSEAVSVDKYFYDINAEEDKQVNSLIYFQNTYMKNTGILYKAQESFDAVAVLSGKVLNVRTDEILGNVVEVEHNTNLRTIYYSLGEVKVKVGDMLIQGQTIGTSGANNISEAKNSLLFEAYYNGALVNPESIYDVDATTLN
jgi:stage II sporulation protein Q